MRKRKCDSVASEQKRAFESDSSSDSDIDDDKGDGSDNEEAKSDSDSDGEDDDPDWECKDRQVTEESAESKRSKSKKRKCVEVRADHCLFPQWYRQAHSEIFRPIRPSRKPEKAPKWRWETQFMGALLSTLPGTPAPITTRDTLFVATPLIQQMKAGQERVVLTCRTIGDDKDKKITSIIFHDFTRLSRRMTNHSHFFQHLLAKRIDHRIYQFLERDLFLVSARPDIRALITSYYQSEPNPVVFTGLPHRTRHPMSEIPIFEALVALHMFDSQAASWFRTFLAPYLP